MRQKTPFLLGEHSSHKQSPGITTQGYKTDDRHTKILLVVGQQLACVNDNEFLPFAGSYCKVLPIITTPVTTVVLILYPS